MKQILRYLDSITQLIIKTEVDVLNCPNCGEELFHDNLDVDKGAFVCSKCGYFIWIDKTGKNLCDSCYFTSPNVAEGCTYSLSQCNYWDKYKLYDPEKCIKCEHEKEKRSPCSERNPCASCFKWRNFEPKHNWVVIPNACPKCKKQTVISDGIYWVCGCGFEYRLNYSGDYLFESESFIESSKSEHDYEMDSENICDVISILQDYVRTAKLDEWEFKHLINNLKDIIRMLDFRLKSVKNPRLQRFCPDCHSVLIEKENGYFYCNNITYNFACGLSYHSQRGVERPWKYDWEITPNEKPIIEFKKYEIPIIFLIQKMILYQNLLCISVFRRECERFLFH